MIARQNMSLLDLAVTATGTAGSFMDIAAANNISPTDALTVGEDYAVPADADTDTAALAYLKGANPEGEIYSVGTESDPPNTNNSDFTEDDFTDNDFTT